MEVKNFSEDKKPKDKTQPIPTDAAQVVRKARIAGSGTDSGDDTVIVRTMRNDLERASESVAKKEIERENAVKPLKEEEKEKKVEKKVKKKAKKGSGQSAGVQPGGNGIKIVLALMTMAVFGVAGWFMWYQLFVIENVEPAMAVPRQNTDIQNTQNPLPPIDVDDIAPIEEIAAHPEPLFEDAPVFDIDIPQITPAVLLDMFGALDELVLDEGVNELFVTADGTPVSFVDLLEGLGVAIDPIILVGFSETHLFVLPEAAGPRLAAAAVIHDNIALGNTLDELEASRDLISDSVASALNTVKEDITFVESEYEGTPLVFQNYEIDDVSFDYAWIQGQPYLLFGTSKDSMLGLIDSVNQLIQQSIDGRESPTAATSTITTQSVQ